MRFDIRAVCQYYPSILTFVTNANYSSCIFYQRISTKESDTFVEILATEEHGRSCWKPIPLTHESYSLQSSRPSIIPPFSNSDIPLNSC